MQVRKLAATASVVGLAAVVAACGSSNSGSSSGSSGSSSSGSSGKNYKLTLIAGVKGDEFYITMNCGAKAEAQAKGATLDFQGPDQFDPSLQTPIVNAVQAKKPDAVLIAPTDTKALYAPIKALADNGSKVVLVDTTLDQPSIAASQIASNNTAGGEQAAKTLLQLTGGKGKYLVINVKPGISTTDQRGAGFEKVIKSTSGATYLGQQYNNDDPAKAASIVTSTLAKNPDLTGIFATNLFGAEGAATGLRQAGKLGKVKIVGFDAGPKQVQDLKDGVVQALIAQQPATIGKDGVDQAINALSGKPVTKKIGTGFSVITKKNLAASSSKLYKSSC
ncbi:MAG: ribose transport system substrate-binding protein [Solirubrobacteraceae bacterium]|jgi:ribose transport system substrate-binding protein|nr:ribose transport system substrate-binding protein [Solirubrobacteraceae bacterium]